MGVSQNSGYPFTGPYKVYSIWGSILGPLVLGNYHICIWFLHPWYSMILLDVAQLRAIGLFGNQNLILGPGLPALWALLAGSAVGKRGNAKKQALNSKP